MQNQETFYLNLILERLRTCAYYQPRFGQSTQGLSLEEFQVLYNADTFYTWFGLNRPLVYSAHRTAGGLTSIYRQLGLGCEQLIRQILQD